MNVAGILGTLGLLAAARAEVDRSASRASVLPFELVRRLIPERRLALKPPPLPPAEPGIEVAVLVVVAIAGKAEVATVAEPRA